MAVVGIPLNSTLVVVYQTGLTPAGGPVLRQKSLSTATMSSKKSVNSRLFQYPSKVARIFSRISPESYWDSLIFHSKPLVIADSEMFDDPIYTY